MNILHVNKLYHPWIGGVEHIAKQLAEGLGGTVLVCQSQGKRQVAHVGPVTVYRAASWGVYLGMPLSFDFFTLFRAHARAADVLFLHYPFPLAFVAAALFGRRKRIFVWYHSDVVRQRYLALLFAPFVRIVLRRAERIFVASDRLAKHSRILESYREKITVVPFGIDTTSFARSDTVDQEAAEIRSRLGTPLILSVGRLTYYKGYTYLIAAMEHVPRAQLLIVGSGAEEAHLRDEVQQMNLMNRVHIIPSVDDLRPYYAAADVFVLASTEPSEAFGIVQAEAMAFGVPVVNTDLPTGVPEVSVHGVTGLTVSPKDSTALAGAMNQLMADPALRKQYGEAGRIRVTTLLNEDIFVATVRTIVTSEPI
jgi:rhamnosyl/mannosyltransferase